MKNIKINLIILLIPLVFLGGCVFSNQNSDDNTSIETPTPIISKQNELSLTKKCETTALRFGFYIPETWTCEVYEGTYNEEPSVHIKVQSENFDFAFTTAASGIGCEDYNSVDCIPETFFSNKLITLGYVENHKLLSGTFSSSTPTTTKSIVGEYQGNNFGKDRALLIAIAETFYNI